MYMYNVLSKCKCNNVNVLHKCKCNNANEINNLPTTECSELSINFSVSATDNKCLELGPALDFMYFTIPSVIYIYYHLLLTTSVWSLVQPWTSCTLRYHL